MNIINVRVKNIRPEHADLKSWIADSKNLYVGRGGIVFIDGKRFPEKDSPFCNPFKLERDGDRAAVLAKYREYINGRPDLIKALKQASFGKTKLGCWCAPEQCHADILAEILSGPVVLLPTATAIK